MPDLAANAVSPTATVGLTAVALVRTPADDDGNSREAQIGELLKEVGSGQDDPSPQASLVSLLEQLPA